MFDAKTIRLPSGDHAGLMLLPCSDVSRRAAGAVRSHDPDLALDVASLPADEGDPPPVRRPGGRGIVGEAAARERMRSGAVGSHDLDAGAARECDAPPVRRPRRVQLVRPRRRQPPRLAAVGPHDVDVEGPRALARERDRRPVGRPGGIDLEEETGRARSCPRRSSSVASAGCRPRSSRRSRSRRPGCSRRRGPAAGSRRLRTQRGATPAQTQRATRMTMRVTRLEASARAARRRGTVAGARRRPRAASRSSRARARLPP